MFGDLYITDPKDVFVKFSSSSTVGGAFCINTQDRILYSWGAAQIGRYPDTGFKAPRPIIGRGGVLAKNVDKFIIQEALYTADGPRVGAFYRANGVWWAFGEDNRLQLGVSFNSATNPRTTPWSLLETFQNTVDIAANSYQSYFLQPDGTIYARGFNGNNPVYGLLGVGNTTNPVISTGTVSVFEGQPLENVVQVSSNGYALDSSGVVWGWGYNSGNGEYDLSPTATIVLKSDSRGALNNIKKIYTRFGYNTLDSTPPGSSGIFALENPEEGKQNGKVWGLGSSFFGTLGTRVSSVSLPVSENITFAEEVLKSDGTPLYAKEIYVENKSYYEFFSSAYALVYNEETGKDDLWSWGYRSGAGFGTVPPYGAVKILEDVTSADAFVATQEGGVVKTWGYNLFGQLAVNNLTENLGISTAYKPFVEIQPGSNNPNSPITSEFSAASNSGAAKLIVANNGRLYGAGLGIVALSLDGGQIQNKLVFQRIIAEYEDNQINLPERVVVDNDVLQEVDVDITQPIEDPYGLSCKISFIDSGASTQFEYAHFDGEKLVLWPAVNQPPNRIEDDKYFWDTEVFINVTSIYGSLESQHTISVELDGPPEPPEVGDDEEWWAAFVLTDII